MFNKKRYIILLIVLTIIATGLFSSYGINANNYNYLAEEDDNTPFHIITSDKNLLDKHVISINGRVMEDFINEETFEQKNKNYKERNIRCKKIEENEMKRLIEKTKKKLRDSNNKQKSNELENQINKLENQKIPEPKKVLKTKVNVYNEKKLNKLKKNSELVIVDETLMNNLNVKKKVNQLFENGSRIAFKKDNITSNEVTKYLSLKNIKKTTKQNNVGIVIYRDVDGEISLSNVSTNIKDEKLEALMFELKNKFLQRQKGYDKKSFIEPKVVKADDEKWDKLDTESDSDYSYEGTVSVVSVLYEAKNHPSDQYDTYVVNKSEVIPKPSNWYSYEQFYVDSADLGISGNGLGVIEEYQPKDSWWSLDLEISNGGITTNASIGAVVSNQTLSGGYAQPYIVTKFDVQNYAGIPSKTKNRITLISSAEIYTNKNLLLGKMLDGKSSVTAHFCVEKKIGGFSVFSNKSYYNAVISRNY